MKLPILALAAAAFLVPSVSYAMPARMIASLKEMDPATRFEQRCIIEAMNRIQKEHHGMVPDEVVIYAFGNPKVKGNVMVAKGAAFRSHNVWRHIHFRCKTSGDRMDVLSFRYKIGSEVPRSDWSDHYLVPQ